jgi:anthranilate phosphoribosyltransferase
MSLREALAALSERRPLSFASARDAFLDLMEGSASESQKGALLMGLASRGETPEEIAGAVSALREKMASVETNRTPILDTCGTGGDGGGTVNISTAAALVCAGAGVAVAKHGNRSVSSRCGSADVLEALGVRIEKMPEEAAREISENNFTFLFAPAFHPAMRRVALARRELGVRTIFNLIGPLCNPAAPTRQLIGVGKFEIAGLLASALGIVGIERAIVFHSENGLDELTPGVAAIGFEVRGTRTSRWRFDAGVLAQRSVERSELLGGDAAENAGKLRGVLDGSPGAIRETVLLNSAAALWVAEAARTLDDAYEMARESLDSGRAKAVLLRAAAPVKG